MNSSYIHITNLLEESLKQAVQEFVNLYAEDSLHEKVKCSISKHKTNGSFLVHNLDGYDLFLFCYLTNFIKYPIETHLLGAEAEINGYVKVKEIRTKVPFSNAEWLQVYNTGTVEEPDAVILTTDKNDFHFYDFGGQFSSCKTELAPFKSREVELSYYESLYDILPKLNKKPDTPWWKLW